MIYLQDRDEQQKSRVEARLLKRQQQKQQKLAEAGIDYDITPVGYSVSVFSQTAYRHPLTSCVFAQVERSYSFMNGSRVQK